MTKLYDHPEYAIEERKNYQWLYEAKLNYFASDIMELLDIEEPDEKASSLDRAFRACNALQLPFNRNFKRVYRCDGKDVKEDWKISPLACYLIVINCNPDHERVAKAQLYFAMNKTDYKKQKIF